MKLILKNQLLVPKKWATQKLKNNFTYLIEPMGFQASKFKKVCGICEEFKACQDARPELKFTSEICPSFVFQEEDERKKYELRFWAERKKTVAFYSGNLKKVLKHFGHLDFKDQRTQKSIQKYGLKFHSLKRLKQLIPEFDEEKFINQKQVAEQWIEKGYGQIKCPARYGKTVLVCYILCQLQQRALILAHQVDLLHQFKKTFETFTNILDISKQSHKRMLGIWKSSHSFYPLITLATWQSFNSKRGKDFLKKTAKNEFGAVFVDESHCSGSPAFSSIVNQFNALYRGGCTATEKRVDDLHIRVNHILGPVVAKGKTKELKCKVVFVETGVKTIQKRRVFRVNFLSKHEERTKFILKNILVDLKNERYPLVIIERSAHFKEFAIFLKKEGYTVGVYNGQTPNRKKFLQQACEKKFHILICQRSMIKLGINIPPVDTIHLVIPLFNPYATYQEISRIRTPYKDKQFPKIVDYIDRGTALGSKYSRLKVYREQGFEVEGHNAGSLKAAACSTKGWGGRG